MAITNVREFEAILSGIRMHLDKYVHAVGGGASVEKARRQLSMVHDALKKKEEISPALTKQFEEAAAVLREKVADDDMSEKLYDLSDYLEFGRKT